MNLVFANADDLAQWVTNNPWFAIWTVVVATVLAIAGIVTSIVTYFLAKAVTKPCYSIRNVNLIHEGVSNKAPELDIHYRGHGDSIKNFSIAKIRFWNAGRLPIEKKNLAPGELYVISIRDGCVIVDEDIIQKKEQSNQFDIKKSQDKTRLTLTFHHIARGEGVVIQIYHTGTRENDITVSGKLVDGNKPKKVGYVERSHAFRLFPRAMLWLLLVGVVPLTLVDSALDIWQNSGIRPELVTIWLLLPIVIAIYYFLPKLRSPPYGFHTFEEPL
jgi:hypothetical protein